MEAGTITVLIETERSNIQNNIFAIVMYIASPEKGNWELKKYGCKKKNLSPWLPDFFSYENKVVRLWHVLLTTQSGSCCCC